MLRFAVCSTTICETCLKRVMKCSSSSLLAPSTKSFRVVQCGSNVNTSQILRQPSFRSTSIARRRSTVNEQHRFIRRLNLSWFEMSHRGHLLLIKYSVLRSTHVSSGFAGSRRIISVLPSPPGCVKRFSPGAPARNWLIRSPVPEMEDR